VRAKWHCGLLSFVKRKNAGFCYHRTFRVHIVVTPFEKETKHHQQQNDDEDEQQNNKNDDDDNNNNNNNNKVLETCNKCKIV
jgi:hypothetical protein